MNKRKVYQYPLRVPDKKSKNAIKKWAKENNRTINAQILTDVFAAIANSKVTSTNANGK